MDQAEIDLQLFNRLLKTSVIKASPNFKTIYERNVIVLDQQNTQKYLNGLILATYMLVLKDVMQKKVIEFNIDENLTQQIREQSSPQAKLFNWNYLCNELDKIGISIDIDTKSLYVAGDSFEIGQLFDRIEQYVVQISNDKSVLDFQDYRKDDRKFNKSTNGQKNKQSESQNEYMNQRRGLQSNQKKQIKDGVDIMQMDTNRQPNETESTLEFILNTLCRAMSMKPKQSAALLTNNNQFLTHCVVKGVKGNYEPMINWYQDIYQYSRHLSDMLEIEIENSIASKDQKQIKAAQLNFEKVMQTISSGCYSQNLQVVQLCFKSLICIAQDFNNNIEAINLSQKWFESKDNGLYNINYAFKRHPEIAEDFVNCIGNFTSTQEQMSFVYLQSLQEFYPEVVDYLNCLSNMFPYLQVKYANQLVEGQFISQLLERCMRYTDSNMQYTPQLRISAISLITEIWLSYSKYVDSQGSLTQMIQTIYQKNSREKSRALRLVTVSCIFKLIDKFSQEKNQSAPILYKQLIFSLVENPSDQTSRELYLTNFQYLFEKNPQIPVGLFLEPFVKINQVRDIFSFVTFDYDFFSFIAQHQKLNAQNAIQMLDLFARQYLNDMCYASAVSVPFILICSRFINTVQCQEFIMKFVTISLNQLLQIDNNNEPSSPPQNAKGKILALLPPSGSQLQNKNVGRGSQVRSSNKELNKDFRISSQKKTNRKDQQILPARQLSQDEQVNNRLKKSYIIQMLLKIQNLKQDDVNNAMRDMLLGAQKQYKDQNQGYLSNGIMAILKYWGDPDQIFNFYLKNQEKIDTEERKALEKIQKQDQIERKMLGYDSDDKAKADSSYGGNSLALKKSKAPGRNSMALMPIVENQANIRALQELEIIKKYKKEKEQEEQRKFEQDIKKKNQKQNKLKEELMKRRVEIGVQQREAGGNKIELNALIYKSDEGTAIQKLSRANKQQIKLVDIGEEEDRDQQILNQFMKKYSKIWKYLFSRYCNQMYSHKGKKDFDDMNNKLLQISLPEIIKILKDHDTYPQLIDKDEVGQIIRIINIASNQENSRDLTMLDYNQFVQFIPQLAFICCSRPPLDMRSFPLIGSLQALLNTFEKATRDRGKSTAIFEDPDTSNFADKSLIAAIEKNCEQNPNYVVPQGFKKQIEMIPIFKYELPQCARQVMKTSQLVVIELLDQILFNSLDIHFLEPIVHFEQKIKVKQQVQKLIKPPIDSNYMKNIEKKVDEQKQKGTAYAQMSAFEKRKEAMEIKPKINLALKLQVTKHDLRDRPHYQEVAEVFEEMLQAVEKGLIYLPPRQNRAPGQIINSAKIQNEQREKEEKGKIDEKERIRQERNKEVKKIIEDTKFGGREMPVADFNKLQQKLQSREKQKQDQLERKNFQMLSQKAKQEVDDLKSKQIEEIKKQREQEFIAQEQEKQRIEMERKQFLSQQKQKHINSFQETTIKRDTIQMKRVDLDQTMQQNQKQLALQVKNYIGETTQQREIEKQERVEIERFIERQDVESVFQQYQKPIAELFKFYAALDDRKNQLSFEDEWQSIALSFKELVQFGKQQNITPEFISTDDLVYIFKRLVREQEDNFGEEIKSRAGMLDFLAFKKAIVRISIVAQEKLGVGNQDQLQRKLLEDQQKYQTDKLMKNMKQKESQKKEEEKQQQLKKLREQFLQEQKQKQLVQQKETKDKKAQQDQINSNNMDASVKAQKEELEFQKWLRQKENLNLPLDQIYKAELQDTPQRATIKKKDKISKELVDLNRKMEEAGKIKQLKVEDKEVRKKMDVSIINSNTIEAFIKYIQLHEQNQTGQVARRLTETMNRRVTIAQRKVSDGAPIPGHHDNQLQRE